MFKTLAFFHFATVSSFRHNLLERLRNDRLSKHFLITLSFQLTRIELSRNHSSINNMITFGDFKKKYDKINWESYFNEEMRSNLGRMPDSLLINVVDINYFDNLYSLIKSKPLSSINNYLMWCLVSNYDTYLPAKFRKPMMEFRQKMYGVSSDVSTVTQSIKEGQSFQDPLWEVCVGEVRDNLAMPLSTEYAHKFFTKKDKGIVS